MVASLLLCKTIQRLWLVLDLTKLCTESYHKIIKLTRKNFIEFKSPTSFVVDVDPQLVQGKV